MNFDDTPEEAEFRAEAHAFLSKHLQSKDGNNARERGSDYLKRAKEWQKIKAAGGFAQITWPKQMGGRGGSAMQQVIWNQEETKFETFDPYLEYPNLFNWTVNTKGSFPSTVCFLASLSFLHESH